MTTQVEEMIAAHDAATSALLAALDNSNLAAAKTAANQLLVIDQVIADIGPRYTDGHYHPKSEGADMVRIIQSNVQYRTEGRSATIHSMVQKIDPNFSAAIIAQMIKTVRVILIKNPKGT